MPMSMFKSPMSMSFRGKERYGDWIGLQTAKQSAAKHLTQHSTPSRAQHSTTWAEQARPWCGGGMALRSMGKTTASWTGMSGTGEECENTLGPAASMASENAHHSSEEQESESESESSPPRQVKANGRAPS
ncbi:hypothetical protein CCHR01_18641 [Colletotrichum chrysophilum]|uniref:Uncharacterized protein n=1 Tax=Colletotrichum chrysophilum TaxID=1836956 RepID=A0AAD9E8H3_9PEZI|nr:hypothetical protein CCHR01_18641 [Colletotrichum chrysophilum]